MEQVWSFGLKFFLTVLIFCSSGFNQALGEDEAEAMCLADRQT